MTEQGHTVTRELVEVQGVPSIGARNVRSRELLFGNGELVRRDVEEADLRQPRDYILAAIATGCSSRAADAQEDASTLLVELLGNLGARLRAADDEHRALRERFRIVIPATVELGDGCRDAGGERGDPWTLLETRGHHHVCRRVGALCRDDPIAFAVHRFDREHTRVEVNR